MNLSEIRCISEFEELDQLLSGHAHAVVTSEPDLSADSTAESLLYGNASARELAAASAMLDLKSGGGGGGVYKRPANCTGAHHDCRTREIAAVVGNPVTRPPLDVQRSAPQPSAKCSAPRTRTIRDVAAGVCKKHPFAKSMCTKMSKFRCLP